MQSLSIVNTNPKVVNYNNACKKCKLQKCTHEISFAIVHKRCQLWCMQTLALILVKRFVKYRCSKCLTLLRQRKISYAKVDTKSPVPMRHTENVKYNNA